MFNEETIYQILNYIRKKENDWSKQFSESRPVQEPWSRWAVDEIISQLKLDNTSYPDEIVRHFISLMKKYEEVAEPERKSLFRIAKNTAEELYSYLFGEKHEKENIPF